jgi:tungstate transport system substrate-binding protein
MANPLRLATTTSTVNSGLIDHLGPVFERESGLTLSIVSVGTGKALRLSRKGLVDVILVHAPPAEKRFVEAGFGVERRVVMHNDFIIVGPRDDPARLRGLKDPLRALRRIAANGHEFISRGDDSGTHKKELALWSAAAVEPDPAWYYEAGQGMGNVLKIADKRNAYTLSDRGTWLAQRRLVNIELVLAGDARLFNPYGVIATNPERHKKINYKGALIFINWITSPRAQLLIKNFTINGERLFVPMAGKSVNTGGGR